MLKYVLAIGAATMFLASSAAAEVVGWRTVVGVIQTGNIVGSFSSPLSCPINGQGCLRGDRQPWSSIPLASPQVTLNMATGDLTFQVSGLSLAGGNEIGTTDSGSTVIGTVMCITRPPGANVIINSAPTLFKATGDATFTGSIGALPPSCNFGNISFFIRKGSTQPWIANGASRIIISR